MKARRQPKTLSSLSLIALLIAVITVFTVSPAIYADGTSGEPPWQEPVVTDTISAAPTGTTSTSTATAGITEPSLLDVVITVIDVIL